MKSFRWASFVLLVGLLAICWHACSSTATAPVTSTAPPLSDWMARLPGTNTISAFSIPGTHDTCALHEPFPGTTRCQVLSIPEQLRDGVRFLDIRCRHVHDEFEIYHGAVDQKLSFADVVSSCLAFLKAQPGECIILCVKEETSPIGVTRTFEKTFDTYVQPNRDQWFLKDYIPTLDETRGRLILFRRFTATNLPKGIAAGPADWRDSTNFWIGRTIRVQDNYVVENKLAKWTAIQDLYQEENPANRDVLFLNFASGYQPHFFKLLPSIPAVSDYINPRLISYWQTAPPGRHGITLMDFADAEKCALIIGANR